MVISGCRGGGEVAMERGSGSYVFHGFRVDCDARALSENRDPGFDISCGNGFRFLDGMEVYPEQERRAQLVMRYLVETPAQPSAQPQLDPSQRTLTMCLEAIDAGYERGSPFAARHELGELSCWLWNHRNWSHLAQDGYSRGESGIRIVPADGRAIP